MLVFISWSGSTSHAVAQVMRQWLKDVMQNLEPWVSSEDIRQGARWSLEVATRLQQARFGLICVTRDNLSAPWLHFEAGALAKTLGEASVCPILIDLKPTEIDGPLVQFQAATTGRADTLKLLYSLNNAMGDEALPEEQIRRSFEKWWPDFHSAITKIPNRKSPVEEIRTDRALLEELVERVRLITAAPYSGGDGAQRFSALSGGLFGGRDVAALLERVSTLGGDTDENAKAWAQNRSREPLHSIEGVWSMRWNGGAAGGLWVNGEARAFQMQSSVYIITSDGRADCLIALKRRPPNILAGRYINLEHPTEVLPWAGHLVSENRIDGIWPQGRWDLRR